MDVAMPDRPIGPPATTEPAALGGPRDPVHNKALQHATRLLALRARTTREITDRLTGAGYPPELVALTVERLVELRLLDDRAFAREWIRERSHRKGLAVAALRRELGDKGVAPEAIEEALEEAAPDQLSAATEVASGHVERLGGLPLPKQAARLQGLLARRGFSEEVCEAAVRAVLPPEGWD